MTIITSTTLVIGRGELYFGRFRPGTTESEGEMYLGNTPGFAVNRAVEEVERFTSYGGQQVKLDTLVLRETNSANITTDNLDMDNMALWFGGIADYSGQTAIGIITEEFVVKRGRHYQLGTSVEPFGVRHVEPDITFTKSGSPLAIGGNFELRGTEGRFFVLDDAVDIVDSDEITVSFQWRGSQSSSTEPTHDNVVGSLRFIATNPVGPRKNYFFPYVALSPSGSFDLKGDQWQQIQLNADVRKLNPTANFFYVLESADAGYTQDESAIIEIGPMSLDDFPFYEDLLDQIINTFIPAADYGQVIP